MMGSHVEDTKAKMHQSRPIYKLLVNKPKNKKIFLNSHARRKSVA